MPEVDSPTYYDVWLETLESLLLQRGLASREDLARLKEAWTEAYLHTPQAGGSCQRSVNVAGTYGCGQGSY
jgi:hypothetical protein